MRLVPRYASYLFVKELQICFALVLHITTSRGPRTVVFNGPVLWFFLDLPFVVIAVVIGRLEAEIILESCFAFYFPSVWGISHPHTTKLTLNGAGEAAEDLHQTLEQAWPSSRYAGRNLVGFEA